MVSILGSCGKVGIGNVSLGHMAARMTAALGYGSTKKRDFSSVKDREELESEKLKTAAAARRYYEKETALLRKKYAAELEEKKKREQKDEELLRASIEESKARRVQLKRENASARAIEVEEEMKILQQHLKEQRATNVTARNKLEARQGLIRHKRMMAVRRQSSMWIQEKDLERRILEAMSNPFHLRASAASGLLDRDDSYYEAEEV